MTEVSNRLTEKYIENQTNREKRTDRKIIRKFAL